MNEQAKKEWLASRKRHKDTMTPELLMERLKKGDPVALSEAITLVESKNAIDKQKAKQLIQMALPETGNSIRIGITGVPGVGKSTFIEAFGKLVIENGKN